MLILNFTYPLRCLRVPPVEYHWPRSKWGCGMDSAASGLGPVVGSYEHCNGPSGSIKGGGIFWPAERVLAFEEKL